MKAALNGSLNLSILDGWWAEFYDEENGWAIPSADSAGDAAERDQLEADSLYDLIEHQVAPAVLRPRRPRACPVPASGCSRCATRSRPCRPRCRPTAWCASTSSACTSRRRAAEREITDDCERAGPRARGVEGARDRRVAEGARRARRVGRGGCAPQVGDELHVRAPGRARRAVARRRARSRSSTAAPGTRTTARPTCQRVPLELQTGDDERRHHLRRHRAARPRRQLRLHRARQPREPPAASPAELGLVATAA